MMPLFMATLLYLSFKRTYCVFFFNASSSSGYPRRLPGAHRLYICRTRRHCHTCPPQTVGGGRASYREIHRSIWQSTPVTTPYLAAANSVPVHPGTRLNPCYQPQILPGRNPTNPSNLCNTVCVLKFGLKGLHEGFHDFFRFSLGHVYHTYDE